MKVRTRPLIEEHRQSERSETDVLCRISQLQKRGVLNHIIPSPKYYDEPSLYQFWAETTRTFENHRDIAEGGGASFNRNTALIKAACEAIERLCMSAHYAQKSYCASVKELKKQAVPLEEFTRISPNQAKKPAFTKFRFDDTAEFSWVDGWSLSDSRSVAIPAQTVFVPYYSEEKIIRLPISTGGASGTSLNGALLRGMLEVIERDAFMIHYLAKTWGCFLDFRDDIELCRVATYFKQYRLSLYLISLPTDLSVYTILALLIDKTGVGPALSAGLKSSLNPRSAALGAITESWQSRPWLREDLNRLPDLEAIRAKSNKLRDIKQRGLMWSSLKMLRYIQPWLENPQKTKFTSLPNFEEGTVDLDLKSIIGMVNSHGYNTYAVDITLPEVAPEFVVVKVIIPSLQPLHLEEPWVYLGGNRLYELPVKLGYRTKQLAEGELNRVPHFFL